MKTNARIVVREKYTRAGSDPTPRFQPILVTAASAKVSAAVGNGIKSTTIITAGIP